MERVVEVEVDEDPDSHANRLVSVEGHEAPLGENLAQPDHVLFDQQVGYVSRGKGGPFNGG